MNILIAGNCQVTPLAKIFAAAGFGISCDAIEVWKLTPEELAVVRPENYDAVISQPLVADRYGVLTCDRLIESCVGTPLLFIHNLFFEGTVPDCTYVGPLGKRIGGAMGTYHSRTVLQAFLAQKSVAECAASLERGENINAQSVWDHSIKTLRAREQAVTVPFVEELLEYVKVQNCFHVFNHPTAYLLERYAEKILAVLWDRSGLQLDTRQPDLLEQVGTWPTYRWLAESLGLPYADEVFHIPKLSSTPLSLREFVEHSYATYRKTGREALIF